MLGDTKIRRVARVTKLPQATVLGAWITLLCLASDSPERGKLKYGEEVWIEFEDILGETGLDGQDLQDLLYSFRKLSMIRMEEGRIEILNWDRRQVNSLGTSTERVRKFRKRKKADETQMKLDETRYPPPSIRGDETADETKSNKNETGELDIELDIEGEKERARAHTRASNTPLKEGEGEDDAIIWQVIELEELFLELTGGSLPSDPERRAADYFKPLNQLLIRTGWDSEIALELLKRHRANMIKAGYSPYKAGAVVPQILAALDGKILDEESGGEWLDEVVNLEEVTDE